MIEFLIKKNKFYCQDKQTPNLILAVTTLYYHHPTFLRLLFFNVFNLSEPWIMCQDNVKKVKIFRH